MLFPLFLDNWLHFLTPAVIEQIFYLTAELIMSTRTPTSETKGEFETHPTTAETKTRQCSK